MVSAIRPYFNHTLIGIAAETAEWVWSERDNIISYHALQIIGKPAIYAGLLYIHPNYFVIGIATGLVFQKKIIETADNINTIWKAQQTYFEKRSFLAIGLIIIVWNVPAVGSLASLFLSSHFIVSFIQDCSTRYPSPKSSQSGEKKDEEIGENFSKKVNLNLQVLIYRINELNHNLTLLVNKISAPNSRTILPSPNIEELHE